MHTCWLDESCVSYARDIHLRVDIYICAVRTPLLFGLRSASKRARSHGTKPSFDALFRCFQWRVYNTGDGTSCIHRTCAHSFILPYRNVCSSLSFGFRIARSPRFYLPTLPLPLSHPSLSLPPSILRRVSFCEKHA